MTSEEKEKYKIQQRENKPEKISRPLGDRLTTVSKALQNYIFNNKPQDETTDEDKLSRLSVLSSKFAGVIRQLLTNPTEKAFVYSNLVAGSGTNLFAAILSLFGYSHVSLSQESPINLEKYKGKKHFILITGNFPTSPQASYLINKVYNRPENKYGDYIQVIVASRIVGEGVNFLHTRMFHNLTPGWNETETQQAQGRVVRSFAHDIFDDPKDKYIKIFRWCAMPLDEKIPSIDFYMYKISEDKDYPIKQIERLLKESAVDCSLNSKRNMRPDLEADGSRECDYSTCVYSCDGVPANWYSSNPEEVHPPLIEDSYNLYYADEQIKSIKEFIHPLFKVKFMYDFYELIKLLPETTELILIRALKEIIDQSIPIINKYGIISYMRESSNFYFLVDNHEFNHSPNLFLCR